MATNTKIVITFNPDIGVGQYISFSRKKGIVVPIFMKETFARPRSQAGQVWPNNNLTWTGTEAATAYVYAFNLDHNSSGVMQVSRLANVVTIEIAPEWTFDNFTTSFLPAGTAVITNGVSSIYVLNTYSFAENAADKCGSVILNVSTSEATTSYSINGIITTIPASTAFAVVVPRGLNIHSIDLYNDTGSVLHVMTTVPYIYINKLLAGNISADIATNVYMGATVTISVDYTNQIQGLPITTLQYSLDGITYIDSNTFTGQVDGDYIVYVKDSFGCVVTHAYSVTEKGNAEAFLYISKNNSIAFSKDEVWDGKSIMKNDSNTLSMSSLNNMNYKEDLLFQYNDNPTIQFKSNYNLNEVILEEECEDVGFSIPVTKMSNNIGRFLSLDSFMYKHKAGLTGIYFDSGNIYDETGAVVQQYILNGNLPDFAIVGQFIDIVENGLSLGYFEILNVVYDSDVNKRVIVINYNYQGSVKEVKTSSTYNLLDFEVYHFNVNFLLYDKENYRLRIKATDPVFVEQNQYSENIYLKEIHDGTVAVEYQGEGNKDIFYAYGITHFIRLGFEDITAFVNDETIIVQGDNSTAVVGSELYDGNRFAFDAMTRGKFLQTAIALSSPVLLINSEGYAKKDSIEYENIPGTNLYKLSASLLKTGINKGAFTNNPSVGSPIIFSPNVLIGSTGLIKL